MKGMAARWVLCVAGVLALLCLVGPPVLAQQTEQSQGDPRLDYMLQCQGCHGADGFGSAKAGVPSIVGLGSRFLGVPEGRAYLVQVPGVAQAPLDDRAIAALMNWILERYRSGAERTGFDPYDEKEVARYRAEGPIDVAATRARLVARREKREAAPAN